MQKEQTSSPCAGDGRPLDLILAATVDHRLHPALLMVGRLRLGPAAVLDLRWPMVNLVTGHLVIGDGVMCMPDPLTDLLYWYGCRQRLDRRRAGSVWPGSQDRVFVAPDGIAFEQQDADEVLADVCTELGLPAIGLEGLRHPCLR